MYTHNYHKALGSGNNSGVEDAEGEQTDGRRNQRPLRRVAGVAEGGDDPPSTGGKVPLEKYGAASFTRRVWHMSQTCAGRERAPEGGITLVRQARQKMAPQWRQFCFTMPASKRRLQPGHCTTSSGSCQRTSWVCSRWRSNWIFKVGRRRRSNNGMTSASITLSLECIGISLASVRNENVKIEPMQKYLQKICHRMGYSSREYGHDSQGFYLRNEKKIYTLIIIFSH